MNIISSPGLYLKILPGCHFGWIQSDEAENLFLSSQQVNNLIIVIKLYKTLAETEAW